MLRNINGTEMKFKNMFQLNCLLKWIVEHQSTNEYLYKKYILLLTTVLMDRTRLRICDFTVGGSKACC